MTRPPAEQPGWLTGLAAALAEALPRLHGSPADPEVLAVIAGLSTALAEGRLELVLEDPAQRQALAASALSADPWGPLVLEGDRVLWRRWQRQRDRVLDALIERASLALAGDATEGLRGRALELAEVHGAGLDADQRRAVAAVLSHRLVLLEGGPGTGKTSTVARMLAAVRSQQPDCRLQLAAPTGKAAARLREAISRSASSADAVPCSTLHRLLESQGERFGRNRHHPLALDLLVIDEVSMVDLPLMEAVLEALPTEARLVLVGDGAQLAPVGPGPVLLELQTPSRRRALGEAAVQLRTPYRNKGALAAVAEWLRAAEPPAGAPLPTAVSAGEQRSAPSTLADQLRTLPPGGNLGWLQASPQRLPAALLERMRRHQAELRTLSDTLDLDDGDSVTRLMAQLEHCLVLTPVRRGRWGVDAIHDALLGDQRTRPVGSWPNGTPVLCQHNLSELGLANGDVGVLVLRPEGQRLLFAPSGGREAVWIHPAQLPSLQPALALTVHKAQGSEADEVWVLLPETGRPTTRLLYTALTRAREQAHLITPDWPHADPWP